MITFLWIIIALLSAIIILSSPLTAMGGITFYNVFFRRKKVPVDKSNRFNHFRLVWFATTREDKFVPLFPWLKKDEWDNFNDD
jgi:hypothetical protein